MVSEGQKEMLFKWIGIYENANVTKEKHQSSDTTICYMLELIIIFPNTNLAFYFSIGKKILSLLRFTQLKLINKF